MARVHSADFLGASGVFAPIEMNSLKFLSSFSFLLPLAMLVLCSETAPGLAFGGTGLCSYRVRGVGGSRAEHLTVESYTIIISLQSYLLSYCNSDPWVTVTEELTQR